MSTPAGWYDDGSGQQRWWNGEAWTEYTPEHLSAAAVPEPMGPKARSEKPWFARWWVWAIAAVVLVGLIGGVAGGQRKDPAPVAASAASAPAKSSAPPTSASPADPAAVTSSPVPPPATTSPAAPPAVAPAVPAEYASALKKAASYSKLMHMSKAGLYQQLTSEYGEKFSAEAAQYAIDNVQADWNANAPGKGARVPGHDVDVTGGHSRSAHERVRRAVHPEEADYAIEHLNG